MSDAADAARMALEEKLAGAGLDNIRRVEMTPATQEVTPVVEEPVEEQTEEVVSTPEEPIAPEVTPPVPEGDPVSASVLAKYGNDPVKLAQAHAELQKKLGEQGSELGEQRQRAAEHEQMRAELDELKARQQAPAPYVDQATVDWFDQATFDNPHGAVEWARSNNNPLLFQRGLATWKEQDPFAASQYATSLQIENAKAEMEQRLATRGAADDGSQMQLALSSVLGQHPEFGQYANDLESVISRYPGVAAGLRGSQEDKQSAIETLFALAERDTLKSIALSGPTPETASTQQVVTATTSQDHPEQEEQVSSPLDEFRQQFADEAKRFGGERAIPNNAYVAR